MTPRARNIGCDLKTGGILETQLPCHLAFEDLSIPETEADLFRSNPSSWRLPA